MSQIAVRLIAVALFLLPGVSAGHPGHGAGHSLPHLVSDPLHLSEALLVATAGALLLAVTLPLARRSRLRARRGRGSR